MGLKKTAKHCYKHAIRRARERYQVFFTIDEMEKLSQRITRREAKHLWTESGSRTHWLLDDQFIVVYNKNTKAITTFLPPEAIWSYLGDGSPMDFVS